MTEGNTAICAMLMINLQYSLDALCRLVRRFVISAFSISLLSVDIYARCTTFQISSTTPVCTNWFDEGV